jgi:hypothetical protein
MEASSKLQGQRYWQGEFCYMPDLGLDMYKLSDVQKWNGKLEQASDSQVLSTK